MRWGDPGGSPQQACVYSRGFGLHARPDELRGDGRGRRDVAEQAMVFDVPIVGNARRKEQGMGVAGFAAVAEDQAPEAVNRNGRYRHG